MHEMVLAVRDEMSVAYPELNETAERVAKVVLAEEEQFARVMVSGSLRFDDVIHNVKRDWINNLEERADADLAEHLKNAHTAAAVSQPLSGRKKYGEVFSREDPSDIATLYAQYVAAIHREGYEQEPPIIPGASKCWGATTLPRRRAAAHAAAPAAAPPGRRATRPRSTHTRRRRTRSISRTDAPPR